MSAAPFVAFDLKLGSGECHAPEGDNEPNNPKDVAGLDKERVCREEQGDPCNTEMVLIGRNGGEYEARDGQMPSVAPLAYAKEEEGGQKEFMEHG